MKWNEKEYRKELKYYINKLQLEEINKRLSFLLSKDEHTTQEGNYFIRSLYFDDYKNTSYYQVLNGISKREKYRIRYYNYDTSYISLEKKEKTNAMVNKSTLEITKNQAKDLIEGKLCINKQNDKLLNEFILKTKFYGYKPVIIIDYNRISYIYKAGNVRITLDYNLSMDYNINNFFEKNNPKIPIIEKNMGILEVKYDEILPNYIDWLLNINNLERTSYSKYLNAQKMKKRIGDQRL